MLDYVKKVLNNKFLTNVILKIENTPITLINL